MTPRNTRSRGTVVGLGLAAVDHLYRVDSVTSVTERIRYDERIVAAGGMVATALVQVVRLGCRARLLTVLGDDGDGRFLLRCLRSAGVGVREVERSEKVPTSVAVVLVDRHTGDRRFLVPDRRRVERRGPRLDLSPIRKGCVLLIDGHYPLDALRAVRRARRVGARVVADFNRPTAWNRKLLPYVDHAIVPDEFAADYHAGSPHDALRKLRDEFGGAPILTQGPQGGLYLDGGRVRRFKTPRITVVDSTGAGDAFHGAFSAGLAQGLSFEANLDRAAHAGARACTRRGGATAVAGRPLP